MEQLCCEEMLRAGTAHGKVQEDLICVYEDGNGGSEGTGAGLLAVPRAGQGAMECRK